MKISLDIPDDLDAGIMSAAEADGHSSRAAAIRKMILFCVKKGSPFAARRLSKMKPRKKSAADAGK